MKKQVLTLLAVATLLSNVIAQTNELKPKPCNTYEAMNEVFKTDPKAKSRFNLIQSQLELEYQEAVSSKANQKTSAATIYTISVVFHIMGTGHSGIVTDQVFTNLITYLNNDYAKTGNDTSQINPAFASLYVDAQIRFALAQKDPSGNCTNGIIRHTTDSKYWNQSSPNYAYSGTGTNRWPTTKYLNVYIVDCIQSSTSTCPQSGSYVAGYTYLPGTFGTGASQDAIVLLSYNGALAQSNPHASRTISHEIGHWLNLSHTFGGTNSPEVNCGDDGIGDTPATKGYFTINTCPSHGGGSYTGCTTPVENDENIMDYGSCPKMFTQGQITKMRTALTSSTAGRNNLITASNYSFTGISGTYTCTPVADLKASKTLICSNQTITYTNLSQVGTSGSIAWAFEGGTPATSTATSQVVTYPTSGTYSVSLVATNSSGSNTLNKLSYITVTNGGGGVIAPNVHNFETLGLPGDIAVINSNVGSIAWEQNTTTGANTTSKSIYLNNASVSSGGNLDIFETPIYNFGNTTNVGLSYWYAYARKTATQIDTFRVQYSLDCGGSWTNVLGAPSIGTMATNTGGTTSTPFVPTSTQWKQATINSALLSALNNKPSVKFRFYFRSDVTAGSSNNIYIDEINLSGTVGINELENALGLTMYPNPTTGMLNVELDSDSYRNLNGATASIEITDVLGQTLQTTSLTQPKTQLNIQHFSAGIYIVNINVNNQRISKKLIIE